MPQTDYEHGLLSFSSALRKRYGLPVYTPYDEQLYQWALRYRCVVTVLVDAMGARLIRKYMPEDAFIAKYMVREADSVYPPTTTSATTSFLTGHYPDETGWLGWHQYFSEIHDEMILFLGKGQYSNLDHGTFAYEALPVRMIYDELNEKGIKADSIWPAFGHHGCQTFEEQCELVLQMVQDTSLTYLYVYWDALDDCMHHHGPASSEAKDMMLDISDTLERLAHQLPDDTGLMVIADHGQIEPVPLVIGEDEVLMGYLRRLPSLEARTISFVVKEGQQEAFEAYFRRHYDSYELYSLEQTVNEHVFGYGKEHPRFREMLGDYAAFAGSKETIFLSSNQILKGHHGGTMADEKKIPLILYPNI